jgi:hypothetical protein
VWPSSSSSGTASVTATSTPTVGGRLLCCTDALVFGDASSWIALTRLPLPCTLAATMTDSPIVPLDSACAPLPPAAYSLAHAHSLDHWFAIGTWKRALYMCSALACGDRPQRQPPLHRRAAGGRLRAATETPAPPAATV